MKRTHDDVAAGAEAKQDKKQRTDDSSSPSCNFPPLSLESELATICSPEAYRMLRTEPCEGYVPPTEPSGDDKEQTFAILGQDPITGDEILPHQLVRLRLKSKLVCYNAETLQKLAHKREPTTNLAFSADQWATIASYTASKETKRQIRTSRDNTFLERYKSTPAAFLDQLLARANREATNQTKLINQLRWLWFTHFGRYGDAVLEEEFAKTVFQWFSFHQGFNGVRWFARLAAQNTMSPKVAWQQMVRFTPDYPVGGFRMLLAELPLSGANLAVVKNRVQEEQRLALDADQEPIKRIFSNIEILQKLIMEKEKHDTATDVEEMEQTFFTI